MDSQMAMVDDQFTKRPFAVDTHPLAIALKEN